MIISKNHKLYLMIHIIDGKKKRYWHLDDELAQDYTICGIGISDSTIESEFSEAIKNKKGGTITCPHCIKRINWFKYIINGE